MDSLFNGWWSKKWFSMWKKLKCAPMLVVHSVQPLGCVWPFASPWTAAHRPPCPSPTPRVHPNSRPLSCWFHSTISSSVIPFSSCLQSLPASGYFQMSQLFSSDSQSIRVSASASVLPKNTQDWFPLGWTGLLMEKDKLTAAALKLDLGWV